MLLFALLVVFIAIAVGLAWFLVAHDRGEKEPISALWIAAGFGLLGALVASLLESCLISEQDLTPLRGLSHLALIALLVGAIEEVCKFVPLALFLYRKRYFNEHTDGVIYFAIAGLGFGLPENIFYTLQYGTHAGFGRIVLTPFFHAAITACVGYILIRGKLAKTTIFHAVLALLAAVLVHAVYDFGLGSGRLGYALLSAVIALGLSVGLFVLFVLAADRDQDEGRSVVGINSFCRLCGQANPRHLLFCTRCGGHA